VCEALRARIHPGSRFHSSALALWAKEYLPNPC
jgi:hypothetical protein